MKYLDPKNDIAFKKIFGTHKNLCISLLNALIPMPEGHEIVAIEYLDSDVLPENPLKKNSVVDVRCTDNENRTFWVEMQLYWSEGFKQRTLLNVTKTYSSQIMRGEKYQQLSSVYALCIINDFFEKDLAYKDKYHYCYTLRESSCPELEISDLCLVFVELPKFKPENKAHSKMKNLWLSFLKDIKEGTEAEDISDDLKANDLTRIALENLEEMSFSPVERESYDKMWDDIAKERTVLFDVEQKVEKGRAEGRAEGREEGRAEGEAIGMQKGEREERLRNAKNFKQLGVDLETISKATGLSKEEIERL